VALNSPRKFEGLQTLRGLYFGRVIHSSPDQWKNDVMELLRFNVVTKDEKAKWSKASNEASAREG
jgi:hypothetical protein